jgi:hypothetical protein
MVTITALLFGNVLDAHLKARTRSKLIINLVNEIPLYALDIKSPLCYALVDMTISKD